MKNVYRATELIGNAYAKFIDGASPEVARWIIHKLQHTFGVAQDIMDIFYNEHSVYEMFTPEEHSLVKISGILHDLARFYQHKDGKVLSNRVFDHGQEAVKMLQDNPYLNDKKMLFAIAEHNKGKINYQNPLYTELTEDEKKKAVVLAKLVRDADKLENISSFIYYGIDLLWDAPKGGLSEGVKQDLLNKRMITPGNAKTAVDGLAYIGAWLNDIYFATTVNKLKNLDFINKCIAALPECGASNDDIKIIKQSLKYHIAKN